MGQGTFATAINCMDGRTQLPVNQWMKSEYGVDYIDTITEPGPDKILADNSSQLVDSIKTRVTISVEKHGSKVVALVGHGECAGNPVSKQEHIDHVKRGMETIRAWGFPVTIIGLWVDSSNWAVEQIATIESD